MVAGGDLHPQVEGERAPQQGAEILRPAQVEPGFGGVVGAVLEAQAAAFPAAGGQVREGGAGARPALRPGVEGHADAGEMAGIIHPVEPGPVAAIDQAFAPAEEDQVGAAPAERRVLARVEHEDVAALAAFQQVIAREAAQQVVAALAGQALFHAGVVGAEEHVGEARADHVLDALQVGGGGDDAAHVGDLDLLAPRGAGQEADGVVARAAVEHVEPRAGAGAAVEQVVAVAAVERVHLRAALQVVVALEAVERPEAGVAREQEVAEVARLRVGQPARVGLRGAHAVQQPAIAGADGHAGLQRGAGERGAREDEEFHPAHHVGAVGGARIVGGVMGDGDDRAGVVELDDVLVDGAGEDGAPAGAVAEDQVVAGAADEGVVAGFDGEVGGAAQDVVARAARQDVVAAEGGAAGGGRRVGQGAGQGVVQRVADQQARGQRVVEQAGMRVEEIGEADAEVEPARGRDAVHGAVQRAVHRVEVERIGQQGGEAVADPVEERGHAEGVEHRVEDRVHHPREHDFGGVERPSDGLEDRVDGVERLAQGGQVAGHRVQVALHAGGEVERGGVHRLVERAHGVGGGAVDLVHGAERGVGEQHEAVGGGGQPLHVDAVAQRVERRARGLDGGAVLGELVGEVLGLFLVFLKLFAAVLHLLLEAALGDAVVDLAGLALDGADRVLHPVEGGLEAARDDLQGADLFQQAHDAFQAGDGVGDAVGAGLDPAEGFQRGFRGLGLADGAFEEAVDLVEVVARGAQVLGIGNELGSGGHGNALLIERRPRWGGRREREGVAMG